VLLDKLPAAPGAGRIADEVGGGKDGAPNNWKDDDVVVATAFPQFDVSGSRRPPRGNDGVDADISWTDGEVAKAPSFLSSCP